MRHVMPCCDGACYFCGRFIMAGGMEAHLEEHYEMQIGILAHDRCKGRHKAAENVPCQECLVETRQDYHAKRRKAHGQEISVDAFRKRLGL